jgi:hypothetical protein
LTVFTALLRTFFAAPATFLEAAELSERMADDAEEVERGIVGGEVRNALNSCVSRYLSE